MTTQCSSADITTANTWSPSVDPNSALVLECCAATQLIPHVPVLVSVLKPTASRVLQQQPSLVSMLTSANASRSKIFNALLAPESCTPGLSLYI